MMQKSASTSKLLDKSREKIPSWISLKTLTKKRYRLPGTGNTHALQAQDFIDNLYPLPKMFGDESYAYYLIDISDPRYLVECARMSRQLLKLQYEAQIIDIEWKRRYNELITHEHRYAALPPSASEKAKTALKDDVVHSKKQLLELQTQKDMYEKEKEKIFDRCKVIKESIKKENDLEQLREEMTNSIRQKYEPNHTFWSTQFDVTQKGDVKDDDDPLKHLEEYDPALEGSKE